MVEQALVPVGSISIWASQPQEVVLQVQSLLGDDLGVDSSGWLPTRGSIDETAEVQSAALVADIARSIYADCSTLPQFTENGASWASVAGCRGRSSLGQPGQR